LSPLSVRRPLKFHPPFFIFLAWLPSWLEVGITGHNVGRGPSKDHSTKVWSKLAQWFLKRRLKCEKFTTDDDRQNMMAKPHLKVYNKIGTYKNKSTTTINKI
jgi:hypothetical protein